MKLYPCMLRVGISEKIQKALKEVRLVGIEFELLAEKRAIASKYFS